MSRYKAIQITFCGTAMEILNLHEMSRTANFCPITHRLSYRFVEQQSQILITKINKYILLILVACSFCFAGTFKKN